MLALAAAAGFAAALLVLVGTWADLVRNPAVAVLAVLLVGLVAVLATREGVHALGLDGPRPSLPRPAKGPSVLPPVPGRPTPAPGANDRRTAGPRSGIGVAAVSATAHVKDDFWRRWLLPRRDPLGAGPASQLPRTVYFPIVPGARPRYSSGRPDLSRAALEVPRVTVPPRPAGPGALARLPALAHTPSVRAVPRERTLPAPLGRAFSEEELDHLFPQEAIAPAGPRPGAPSPSQALGEPLFARREPSLVPEPRLPFEDASPGLALPRTTDRPLPETFPARSPGPVGTREAPAPLQFAPAFAGVLGSAWPMDLMDHPVDLEAINPVPPHLRADRGPEPGRRPADTPPVSLRPSPARACAMCARQLWDFRSWGECPGCGDPVCEPCLRRSFVTGAEGHCSTCRAEPAWPAT